MIYFDNTRQGWYHRGEIGSIGSRTKGRRGFMELTKRVKNGVFVIGLAIVVCVALGALFGLVAFMTSEKPFLECFVFNVEVMLMFSAGGIVGGLLLITTRIPDDLTFGYGCALFYGTVFGGYALSEIIAEGYEEWAYIIAFAVDVLICYIIWLNEFKGRYPEDAEPPSSPAVTRGDKGKKQRELRKKIADLEAAIKQKDVIDAENEKILEESFTNEDLSKMVAAGEFPAEYVSEYIKRREALVASVLGAPAIRATSVRMLENMKKELAEMEAQK